MGLGRGVEVEPLHPILAKLSLCPGAVWVIEYKLFLLRRLFYRTFWMQKSPRLHRFVPHSRLDLLYCIRL